MYRYLKRAAFCLTLFLFFHACAGLGVRPDAQSEFEVGLSLFNRGLYEEALSHFEKATELDPDFARAYLYLGRSYLSLRRWSEAIPPLRTAYRLAPEETKKEAFDVLLDALLGAAMAELKRGNFLSSISLFKEVIELDPRSSKAQKAQNELVGALVAFGKTLLAEGKAPEASKIFQETTELAPRNFEAYLGLARAFMMQGEIFKAFVAVGDAMKIDPSNPEAQSLFQELRR